MVVVEDFKKGINSSIKEIQENTGKQVEVLKEETNNSIKEIQENTINQMKKLNKMVPDLKVEGEVVMKTKREANL